MHYPCPETQLQSASSLLSLYLTFLTFPSPQIKFPEIAPLKEDEEEEAAS